MEGLENLNLWQRLNSFRLFTFLEVYPCIQVIYRLNYTFPKTTAFSSLKKLI